MSVLIGAAIEATINRRHVDALDAIARRKPALKLPQIATGACLALAAMLGPIGMAYAASTMDDRFDASAIDACRWEDLSHEGAVSQSGALELATTGLGTFGSARVLSQARLVGDFDIQVGYRRLAGFETPPAGSAGSFPQLNVALGLWWDESRFIQFSRSRRQDGEWLLTQYLRERGILLIAGAYLLKSRGVNARTSV